MKTWVIPDSTKINKVSLVDSEDRPAGAVAEWPAKWSRDLIDAVEIQLPSGKVKISIPLLSQRAKRSPTLFMKAKEAGLAIDPSDRGFFKRLFKRIRKR